MQPRQTEKSMEREIESSKREYKYTVIFLNVVKYYIHIDKNEWEVFIVS